VRVPPSCPFSGVVVIIAAHRARNAEETERNRPAPPVSPERCSQIDTRLSSKQREPARYRPRAPSGPRCSSGRVGLQNRPGGCESLRTCQFSWRLGRSSDGAWLKTTRARRATASLHHFHGRKRAVPPPVTYAGTFRATRNPAPSFFGA
jgi:hypothetical protein